MNTFPKMPGANMPTEFRTAIGDINGVEKRLTLRIPGSSANIGPGFDTFALGLHLFTWIDFALLAKGREKDAGICLCGEVVKDLPADDANMIWQILSNELKAAGKQELLSRMRVTEYSELPLERGLGSSGSAIVGTTFAARRLLNDAHLSNDEVLLAASEYESHIDNMSASLLGNFVVVYKKEQEIITTCLPWPQDWEVFAVVPSYSVKTSHSRSILPNTYTKEDVVENLQRASLVTAAVSRKDASLLKRALGDRLHEPYRMRLIPELQSLRSTLSDQPVLGCVLSGAGSSMLVIVEHKYKGDVHQSLNSWAEQQSCAISVIETSVDTDGLTIMSDHEQ